MSPVDLPARIAVLALPLLFGVVVHEVAHGWVAWRLGDPTARDAGRLTLNPLRHVDPVGTVLVPAVLGLLSGFVIGWAKPVPVRFARLGHPRRDTALVAAAGPAANLAMALGWALVVKLTLDYHEWLGGTALALVYAGVAGVFVNAVLCVFNLIPVPPLDGGRVLTAVLPRRAAVVFARLEPFGLLVVVALMLTGWLGRLIGPGVALTGTAITGLIGISPDLIEQVLSSLLGGS